MNGEDITAVIAVITSMEIQKHAPVVCFVTFIMCF